MNRPILNLDLTAKAAGALPALDRLAALTTDHLYHQLHNLRHPRGIYSSSVQRVCEKVSNAATTCEEIFRRYERVTDLKGETPERKTLVDQLELCLYAAAEHVDDLQRIVDCFFSDDKARERSPAARAFSKAIKPIRDPFSNKANAIKHHHARIRLYALEFTHDGRSQCLQGMFLEEHSQGRVGPSLRVHKTEQEVLSVPALLWSYLIYIYEMSLALQTFMNDKLGEMRPSCTQVEMPTVARAAVALARLPNYVMDGAHPFERLYPTICGDEQDLHAANSGLYGSMLNDWTDSNEHAFGGFSFSYDGDGVTNAFALVAPKSVGIRRWSQGH